MSTVNIIDKGKSNVLHLPRYNNNFTVHAKYILGHRNNMIADALSRFQMTKSRPLAPQANEKPTLCSTSSADDRLTEDVNKLVDVVIRS